MEIPKTGMTIDAAMKSAKEEGHMMTLEDITKKLHEDFPDEISDANTYLSMAECAYQMEHQELAHYLCEMAKDEFSHATFIHEYLKKTGIPIDEEDAMEWSKLEERFRKKFREA